MVKSKKESITKVEAALNSKTKPSKKIAKRDVDIPKKQKKELIQAVEKAPPKKKKKKAKVVEAEQKPIAKLPNTLFVGHLPFHIEKSHLENFFKEVGEIVNVRLANGIAHVEFASVEAAQNALKLNGEPLLGRNILVDVANTKPPPKNQVKTIFVTRFDKSVGENEMKAALTEHFSACGEIKRISLPWDREGGTTKGIAYLDLKGEDGFNKALELNGSELGGWNIVVTEASPKEKKADRNSGRGNDDSSVRGRGNGDSFKRGPGRGNGETVQHPAKQM